MGTGYLIGIDEVGRGPLAGPLCVGACAVKRNLSRRFHRTFKGVRDSKKLSALQREKWFEIIQTARKEGWLRGATTFVGQKQIDEKGLTRCLNLAIRDSLKKISADPARAKVLLDGGIHAPKSYKNQETIIKGDEKEPIIALASILAKVTRDNRMGRYAKKFPFYGFEKNKGYGTKDHKKALAEFGLCVLHRKSFLTCGSSAESPAPEALRAESASSQGSRKELCF